MTAPIAKKEPALIIGFIMAVLGLAASFGLDLTAKQIGGIYTALLAGGALWTRQVVYSPHTIEHMRGTLKASVAEAKRRRLPK